MRVWILITLVCSFALTLHGSVKQIYLTPQPLPKQIFVGEVFAFELKVTNTSKESSDIRFSFSGARSVERFASDDKRVWQNSHTFIQKFYFKALSKHARLPRITPTLYYSNGLSESSESLRSIKISATTLNPPQGFANIVADGFEITHAKTTSFDLKQNILIFMAKAYRSDLSDFKLSGVSSQGFESERSSAGISTMTYYVILDKTDEALEFSYFNLKSKNFVDVRVPIVVQSDSVSTQSDLRPSEYGHLFMKRVIGGAVALIFLTLFIIKRSKIYLAIAVVAGVYTALMATPMKQVCVKEGAKILLLPVSNSTVFDLLDESKTLQQQGSVENYLKVKLSDSKVGWVSVDDLCKN